MAKLIRIFKYSNDKYCEIWHTGILLACAVKLHSPPKVIQCSSFILRSCQAKYFEFHHRAICFDSTTYAGGAGLQLLKSASRRVWREIICHLTSSSHHGAVSTDPPSLPERVSSAKSRHFPVPVVKIFLAIVTGDKVTQGITHRADENLIYYHYI